jgi:THO complex subunit 2
MVGIIRLLRRTHKTHKPRCCSRELLIRLHCDYSKGDRLDELVTVYQTLLTASLSTWSATALSSATFVLFVQSVLASLPSSSVSSAKSADALVFGEALVDMIWSTDIELDEIVAEAKAAESSKDTENEGKDGLSQWTLARQHGENDKDTLADIVKQLLVRFYL